MNIQAPQLLAFALLVPGCFAPNTVDTPIDEGSSSTGGSSEATSLPDPSGDGTGTTGTPSTTTDDTTSGSETTMAPDETTDPDTSGESGTTGDPNAVCGDGLLQAGESCDDGELNGISGMTDCLEGCTVTSCGDGFVGLPETEECDQGDENADDGPCTAACAIAICGDNLVGPGESCDDGPKGSDDCTADCALASCGDGIVQTGEDCDDENDDDTDSCVNCVAASCGDGAIEAGEEECDDGAGNGSEPPMCAYGVLDADCTYCAVGSCTVEQGVTSYCGDGVVQADEGESCDGIYANAACNGCAELECDEGYADCDGDLNTGCEVDLTTTATSCGSCGHSCLDGACEDAECQPYALYATGDINRLVVNEDSVFFITDSTLEVIPQEAVASSTIVESGLETTGTSRLDQNDLYVVTEWGSNAVTNEVVRIPKVAGATIDVYDPGNDGYSFVSGVEDIAVASNRVYWRWTAFNSGSPAVHFLRGAAINGGTIRTYVSDSADPIGAIEATSSTVFWSEGGDTDALLSRPAGGALFDTVVRENVTSCNSIVAGSNRLYFSCRDGATNLMTLFATDFDGANEEVLLTEDDAEFDDGFNLALSEDDLVWNDNEGTQFDPDNYIRTVRTDGTQPRTVRAGAFEAVDSEAYFWESADEIWMLAK